MKFMAKVIISFVFAVCALMVFPTSTRIADADATTNAHASNINSSEYAYSSGFSNVDLLAEVTIGVSTNFATHQNHTNQSVGGSMLSLNWGRDLLRNGLSVKSSSVELSTVAILTKPQVVHYIYSLRKIRI